LELCNRLVGNRLSAGFIGLSGKSGDNKLLMENTGSTDWSTFVKKQTAPQVDFETPCRSQRAHLHQRRLATGSRSQFSSCRLTNETDRVPSTCQRASTRTGCEWRLTVPIGALSSSQSSPVQTLWGQMYSQLLLNAMDCLN